jgi:hypothetical protein
LPGVGYVRVDGVREPARVRAGYLDDDDIAAMVAAYAPRRMLDGEQLFQVAEHDAAAEVIDITAAGNQQANCDGKRQAS